MPMLRTPLQEMPAPHWKPPRPLKNASRSFESTRCIRQSHSVVARIRGLYYLWQTQAELLIHLISHREAAARAKSTTRKRKSGANTLSQLITNVDIYQDKMNRKLVRYQRIVKKRSGPTGSTVSESGILRSMGTVITETDTISEIDDKLCRTHISTQDVISFE